VDPIDSSIPFDGGKYDVLFSPSQLDALLFCPLKTKQIISVLDLIPFVLKEQKHRNMFFLKTIFPIALKKICSYYHHIPKYKK